MKNDLKQLVDEHIHQHRAPLINAIVVYQNDKLVFERYFNGFVRGRKNAIKSVWKSLLSLCVGICLDEGLIGDVSDPICKYLAAFDENEHAYHKLIRVEHLLTMSSGIYWTSGTHYHCPMLEQMWLSEDWVGHVADTAMKTLPGQAFVYKEWDVVLLSAIIRKVTGMPAYDFCEQTLFGPLGIESERWAEDKKGVSYSIHNGDAVEDASNLSAFDLAKIGRLVLNKGVFEGKRIVSEGYIHQLMTPSAVNRDYGYLWWLLDGGVGAKGSGGQEINVIPAEDLVYVIQATSTSSPKSYFDLFELVRQWLKDS